MLRIGTDIVNLPRFARALERWGDRLTQRLFTRGEIARAEGAHRLKELAGDFAAKEALLKAIGTGLADGIRWQDVEVVRDMLGAPSYSLSGKAASLIRGEFALSISHDGDYVIAVCILEEP
ncbi:MAG: holo-ACP synthase [candidate division WOR-3 bacterium]